MIESQIFQTVLELLIKNALPIVAIYWFLDRPVVAGYFKYHEVVLELRWGINSSALKRYVALVLSVIVSTGLYVLYSVTGYADLPSTFVGWADLILTLGAINFTGTQVIHAKDL